jgi:hypothetical protein
MRAGTPSDCVTPSKEVLGQCFGGGVPGAMPYLLEFNFEKKAAVKSWGGILSYHDFELLDNGSILAWKSFGIGKGKLFMK